MLILFDIDETLVDHYYVLISEECAWAKPAPEIFLHACAAAGEPPTAAFHVGDSYELDASAARLAGLTGVWLDRRRSAGSGHVAPLITTLAELPDLVAPRSC